MWSEFAADGAFEEGIPGIRGEADLESLEGIVIEAATMEVIARGQTLLGIPEHVFKEPTGGGISFQQSLSLTGGLFRAAVLRQLDTDAPGEDLHSLFKLDAISSHDEIEGGSTGLAAKAVKGLPARINVERRSLFLVERTKSHVVSAAALEGDSLANQSDKINCLQDLCPSIWRHLVQSLVCRLAYGPRSSNFFCPCRVTATGVAAPSCPLLNPI